jgi:hypothetical protein
MNLNFLVIYVCLCRNYRVTWIALKTRLVYKTRVFNRFDLNANVLHRDRCRL